MSPQSSSPLQHVTRKGAIFFVACIVFGRRKGMRPGRIGPFQSHPLAKSQTLDCMPEMSSSSGASSSSLQACAALSHGLCLVRRMRASWGRWKRGRRFSKHWHWYFVFNYERGDSIASLIILHPEGTSACWRSVFSQSASQRSTWSSWPGVVCAWEFSTRCCCALVCGVVFLYLLKKILGYLEMTLQMQISENRAIEGSNRAIEGCCVSSPGAQRSYRSFATWTMGCSNLFASCQGSAPLTPRACGFQRMGTSTRCTSSRQTFRTRASRRPRCSSRLQGKSHDGRWNSHPLIW